MKNLLSNCTPRDLINFIKHEGLTQAMLEIGNEWGFEIKANWGGGSGWTCYVNHNDLPKGGDSGCCYDLETAIIDALEDLDYENTEPDEDEALTEHLLRSRGLNR